MIEKMHGEIPVTFSLCCLTFASLASQTAYSHQHRPHQYRAQRRAPAGLMWGRSKAGTGTRRPSRRLVWRTHGPKPANCRRDKQICRDAQALTGGSCL